MLSLTLEIADERLEKTISLLNQLTPDLEEQRHILEAALEWVRTAQWPANFSVGKIGDPSVSLGIYDPAESF